MQARKELFTAAERLHAYLAARHERRGLVRGPDAGVRFNLRAWRFLKSALDFIAWRDNYLFMQTQGYWILANWMLFEATGNPRFRECALESSEAVLDLQTADGYWTYPLPERQHLIATVEGNWAAIGLLATYVRERHERFLKGATRWYDFLVQRIGFQPHATGEAINYFDRPRGKIPNNSVEAAWFFLRLWRTTGEDRYLEHVESLLQFVRGVQLPSGELPYVVASPYERRRDHYLCFQYNAFQFLKLAWCHELHPATSAKQLLPGLARFLSGAVTSRGACAKDCFHSQPEVDYYTAALAAALDEAARLGLAEGAEPAHRCYARLLSRQRPDGSFAYSTGDYGFLRDSRSYPRALAMTLFHLLLGARAGNGFPRNQEGSAQCSVTERIETRRGLSP
jgi:hypothetical protein